MLTIYHNNSCSKSCSALDHLKQSGEEFEVINYLEDVPSIEELKLLLAKLQCKPHDIIRTNEKVYLENFAGKELTDEEWLMAMYQNPILIQRPIVVKGNHAVIARSAEAFGDII